MDLKSKKTLTVTNDIPVDNKITISGSVKISSGGTRAHDKLSNLDYASSGHTGFASEEQINGLQEIVNELQENLAATNNLVDGLTDAFQFEGKVDSVEQLPAAAESNKGHVYIIGDKEYASNGTEWIELGGKSSGEGTSVEANVSTKRPIPTSGTIGGLYFDTSKTPEEVNAILENIQYHIDGTALGQDMKMYFAFGVRGSFDDIEIDLYAIIVKEG